MALVKLTNGEYIRADRIVRTYLDDNSNLMVMFADGGAELVEDAGQANAIIAALDAELAAQVRAQDAQPGPVREATDEELNELLTSLALARKPYEREPRVRVKQVAILRDWLASLRT